MIAVELTGWVAAAALLLAYGLVSDGRVATTSRRYVLFNLAGSAGLAVNGAAHGAWPSVALNTLWLAIAVRAEVLRRRSAADGLEASPS